jgi:hypothetical protein
MDVLYEERDYSVAIGRWDKKLCLGMRWNGSKDKRIGNPQSRGLPTWFIVPAVFQKSILDSLPDGDSSKVAYARFLLSRK